MNIHTNARLCLRSREALVLALASQSSPPLTLKAAAAAFKVSSRTAAKWRNRFAADGATGLRDRSSRPLRSPRQTPPAQVAVVLALRQHHRLPAFQIARLTTLSKTTVSRLLRRHNLHHWRHLDPPPAIQRYERSTPGELLHLDIKRLARFVRPGVRVTADPTTYSIGAGYEYVHVAIDDHSRLAFAQIWPDQSAASALGFLHAALAYFHRLGISIQRLLTDNGSCYRSDRFAAALLTLRIKHKFTRPYTPRTNGKAERFIQTSLREWAYARAYQNSSLRAAALQPFLHFYNWHRPHHALQLKPPASRLGLKENNVLTLHTYRRCAPRACRRGRSVRMVKDRAVSQVVAILYRCPSHSACFSPRSHCSSTVSQSTPGRNSEDRGRTVSPMRKTHP